MNNSKISSINIYIHLSQHSPLQHQHSLIIHSTHTIFKTNIYMLNALHSYHLYACGTNFTHQFCMSELCFWAYIHQSHQIFLTIIRCMRKNSPNTIYKINYHQLYIVQTYVYLTNVNTIIQHISHQTTTPFTSSIFLTITLL